MKTKTKNKLFFNGCSYTYGIGVADTSNEEGREELKLNRYSKLVSDYFGLEEHNVAQPGSSNFRIARHTYSKCIPEETKLAIIMWSDAPRMEIFRPQENEYDFQELAQITPQGANGTGSYDHREALLHYYTFLHTEEAAITHTMNHMSAVEMYFRYYNIPVVHLHYKPNFERTLRHCKIRCKELKGDSIAHANLLTELESQESFLKENPLTAGFDSDITSFNTVIEGIPSSTYSLGHPSKEGHRVYSEWLINHIETNNVIS